MKKIIPLILILSACYSSSPDKTIGGAILGAGWGAGAGAVVGHQLQGQPTGEGAAIGAGFGLLDGAVTGASIDSVESEMDKQNRELEEIRVHNRANSQELVAIQESLDFSPNTSISGVESVYFDYDVSSLRTGSIANLEVIAEAIKSDSGAKQVVLTGHADDSGDPEYNKRLAEARARNVSSYLAAKGLATDRIKIEAYGSERPIASNTSESGRQLNRRVDLHVLR